jgi:RNA polymerase sigma factor (sigma-70 family)
MSQGNDLLQHLRANGLRLRAETDSDGQLLARFLDDKDEVAFEALVARLGPMVWAVCRRQLPDPADAEDAFQATFLVLARKGRTVNPRDRVANWLYGVAYTAARKARVNRARRRDKEHRAAAMTKTVTRDAEPTADLAGHIDRELSRLPDKYRAPVVLCDMQGKTRQEAARHLGWPEGTVAGRLARAREMLARRLGKYALGVSPAAVAAVLSDPAASQGPPVGVAVAARQGALGLATIPPRAAILADGVTRSIVVRKVQVVAVGLALTAVVGIGVAGLLRTPAPRVPTPPPTDETPVVAVPPDPLAAVRAQLAGRWQVDAGTRDRLALTDWERRGYLIDFDDRVLRLHRGNIHGQRTFTWTIDPATPQVMVLTRADGAPAARVRMSFELKDDGLTLSWDEPPGSRGRGPSAVRLTLSRAAADGPGQGALTVAPAAENVVGSRLAGDWEPDEELSRRLGANAAGRLTFVPDPAVARQVPAVYQPMFAGKRIYLAGRLTVPGATYPFLLVEHLGNPLLVYFLPDGPEVCANEEAATVVLVPGADRKDDLLVVTPFDTARHAPAGGYRRVVKK